MLLNLVKRYTLLGIKYEELLRVRHVEEVDRIAYSLNQILGFGAYEIRDRHLASGYPPLRHDWSIFERSFADQEFVGQDTQAPEVTFSL